VGEPLLWRGQTWRFWDADAVGRGYTLILVSPDGKSMARDVPPAEVLATKQGKDLHWLAKVADVIGDEFKYADWEIANLMRDEHSALLRMRGQGVSSREAARRASNRWTEGQYGRSRRRR
jgi:hypothetical protein